MNLWRNCTIAGESIHILQHPKVISQHLDRVLCIHQHLSRHLFGRGSSGNLCRSLRGHEGFEVGCLACSNPPLHRRSHLGPVTGSRA